MDKDIDQKIEAYLGGDMKPDERLEFEERITQDSELKKRVQLSDEVNHHFNENTWLEINNYQSNSIKRELKEYLSSTEAASIKSNIEKAGEAYNQSKAKTENTNKINNTNQLTTKT